MCEEVKTPGLIKSEQARGVCDNSRSAFGDHSNLCKSGKSNEYACLCQGATGRVCEVIWMCEDCAAKMIEPRPVSELPTAAQARELWNAKLPGCADF